MTNHNSINFVVSIVGDKGGIGKTTLAWNLLWRFIYAGESACLIDCDDDQFSSANFSLIRANAGLKPDMPVFNISTANLESDIIEISKTYKIILIEFGKANRDDNISKRNVALELAVKLSDLILKPVQASPIDAQTIGKFEDKMPPQIKNIPAFLIPNRVKSSAQLNSLLAAESSLKYFKFTKTHLKDRLCYQDAFGLDGRSIFELRAKSDSEREGAREFEQLFQELFYE